MDKLQQKLFDNFDNLIDQKILVGNKISDEYKDLYILFQDLKKFINREVEIKEKIIVEKVQHIKDRIKNKFEANTKFLNFYNRKIIVIQKNDPEYEQIDFKKLKELIDKSTIPDIKNMQAIDCAKLDSESINILDKYFSKKHSKYKIPELIEIIFSDKIEAFSIHLKETLYTNIEIEKRKSFIKSKQIEVKNIIKNKLKIFLVGDKSKTLQEFTKFLNYSLINWKDKDKNNLKENEFDAKKFMECNFSEYIYFNRMFFKNIIKMVDEILKANLFDFKNWKEIFIKSSKAGIFKEFIEESNLPEKLNENNINW